MEFSISTPEVSEHDNKALVSATILPSSSHVGLSRALTVYRGGAHNNATSPITISMNNMKTHFLRLTRRVRQLEQESAFLQRQGLLLQRETARLQAEIQANRVSHYELVAQRRKNAAHLLQEEERADTLELQTQRFGEFVLMLADVEVDDNPLYRAALAVMDGAEADDAIIAAICEAAEDTDSIWYQLLSEFEDDL